MEISKVADSCRGAPNLARLVSVATWAFHGLILDSTRRAFLFKKRRDKMKFVKNRFFALFGLIALVLWCGSVAKAQTYTDSYGYTWVYTITTTGTRTATVTKVVPTASAVSDLNVTAFPGSKVIFKGGAFAACKGMKSIVLPAMTSDVTPEVFAGCDGLESFSVATGSGQTYSSINGMLCKMSGDQILLCPNALESVEVPEGVVSLGARSFVNCSKLKTIRLPKSLAGIDEFAFLGCENLEDVYYNGTVSSWGVIEFQEDITSTSKRYDLFSFNNPLYYADNLYIPQASGAWSKVTKFTYQKYQPKNVYNFAFYGYKGMESVTIEGGLKVGSYSFAWCGNLKSLKLGDPEYPTNVYPPMHRSETRWVVGSSFAGCTNLVDIQVLPACAKWCEVKDGVVYSTGLEQLLLFPSSKTEYFAPDTLTPFMCDNRMAGYGSGWGFNNHFTDCCLLEKLRLPDKCGNVIGEGILYNAGVPNKFTVYVPTNYTVFTQYTFRNCAPGTTIVFEGKPNEAEGGYCGVAWTENVAKIGITGQYSSSWYSHISSSAEKFFLYDPQYKIDYDARQITGVKVDNRVWKLGVSPLEVVVNSNVDGVMVESVGDAAFKGGKRLCSAVIGDGILSIGEDAFYECENLTNVVIASSVDRIGARAFEGTSIGEKNGDKIASGWLLAASDNGLGEYQVPDCVQHIADGAFAGCLDITSVSFHCDVVSVGKNAFLDTGIWSQHGNGLVLCDGWVVGYKGDVPSALNIPDGVVGIADEAFANSSELQSVVLPQTLRFIGVKAFFGCNNLTKAQFGNVDATVGRDAFLDCHDELKLPLTIIMRFDATGGTMPSEVAYVKVGDEIGTLPVPEKDGYQFTGWFDAEDRKLNESDIAVFGCSYRATWVESFVQVEFSAMGGECAESARRCERGLPIGALPVPTRYGYDFDGWFTKMSGGDRISAGFIVAGPTCYYAHWLKSQYLVQFVVDGVVVKKTWVYHGDTVIAPKNPSKVGYNFVGWDHDVQKGISGETTFTAVWEQIICTVQFEISEGQFRRVGGGDFEQRVPYGAYAELPIVEPIGEYKFKEWPKAASEKITTNAIFVAKVYRDGYHAGVQYSFDAVRNRLILSGDGAMGVVERGGWYEYLERTEEIEVRDGITTISDNAFTGFNFVKSVLIASTVTNIGTKAFSYCSGIKKVVTPVCFDRVAYVFPIGVEEVEILAAAKIPRYFFTGSELRKIIIPSTVTLVEGSAFYSCSGDAEIVVNSQNPVYTSYLGSLYSKDMKMIVRAHIVDGAVSIPDGVDEIYAGAFGYCSKLRSIELPDTITTIGDRAFESCTGLEKVNFPTNLQTIGLYAFASSGLKSVELPSSVVLETSSFSGCVAIKNLTMPVSVQRIRDYFPSSYKGLTNLVVCSGVKILRDEAIGGCERLKTLTIPATVTEISKNVFCYYRYDSCSSLSRITFLGNEPITEDGIFNGVAKGCTAYVKRSGVIWDVEIPGTWRGILIDYLDERDQAMYIQIDPTTGNATTNFLAIQEALDLANELGSGRVCTANLNSNVGLSSGVELVVTPEDDKPINVLDCYGLISIRPTDPCQDVGCFKIVDRLQQNNDVVFEVKLDETKFDFAEMLSKIVDGETLSEFASCASGEAVMLNLPKAKEGFYYGVDSAADLSSLSGNCKMYRAGSSGVSVPIVKPVGDAAFFKVVVGDRAK